MLTTTDEGKRQYVTGMNKVLQFIWDGIIRVQKFILILSSVLIVIGISLSVLFRYILKTSMFGMEDLLAVFAIWLYFIGGSYGSYERSHISADMVSSYIRNKKIRAVIQLINSIITVFLSLLLTYWAYEFIMWTFERGSKSPVLGIPNIVPQSAVFIGFILMSFYFIVYLLKDIKNIFSVNSPDDVEEEQQ